MKNSLLLTGFLILFFNLPSFSQSAPVWIKDINALPDTANVYPVRCRNDAAGNAWVLSTYSQMTGPAVKNKVYLKKFDPAGTVVWTLVYDNGGSGQPRGFDMVLDAAGNCYIAGGWMATPNFKPLLLKINAGGNVLWQRDSTASFNTGKFNQVILHNAKLNLRGDAGLAQFDLNGNETWSNTEIAEMMKVDHAGQVIYSSYTGSPDNIFRLDSNGVQNFSDSTFIAGRIAVDDQNSFYLLGSVSQYELSKYDSSGTFQWYSSAFPQAPPFGDIGYEVVTDFNNDVLLVGLSDTMFKFDNAGNLLWTKPMYGLDSYLISAQVVFNNFLAVAGTVPGGNGYDMYVSWFDLNGVQNWAGTYSSNDSLTEFTQDMSIDGNGVYVLENNDQKTTFVKFDSPLNTSIVDYTKVCIDSVWYDVGNLNYYNVRVFNGNIASLNYPSVRMVSIFGDTAGNPFNNVSFFAHIGNSYLVYHDTITDPFITNFQPYSFFVCENFGDTMTQVGWCTLTGIQDVESDDFLVYPNPVQEIIYADIPVNGLKWSLRIFDAIGREVQNHQNLAEGKQSFDVSGQRQGLYLMVFETSGKKIVKRFCRF